MYARVISVTIQPGHEDDLLDTTTSMVLPVAREQAGFVDAVGLFDPSTGRMMFITLWADAHCLESSEASGHVSSQLARVAPYLKGPAVRETFEVVIPPAGQVPQPS
ncbi:MAG TPA: antibiotic biosynthesis monooxygenase [Thermomicrobiales bacterium]|jgi:quinol monooxygenase YgiN|nr:hypothetical protein [Chloroflexota bacterium]HBY45807.1 hypothetical protein [Chloroflexota bacterium]HCG28439.1 hypothetical protein [Chloroflexota bacterium]HQZ90063.1 antibiotic biosynthesis monooxygenase [Thermomicrobiales bacterium]HRA32960.1 antibiotic biosynthesis monooxygenase [Thermomicrobiales bacterium]